MKFLKKFKRRKKTLLWKPLVWPELYRNEGYHITNDGRIFKYGTDWKGNKVSRKEFLPKEVLKYSKGAQAVCEVMLVTSEKYGGRYDLARIMVRHFVDPETLPKQFAIRHKDGVLLNCDWTNLEIMEWRDGNLEPCESVKWLLEKD